MTAALTFQIFFNPLGSSVCVFFLVEFLKSHPATQLTMQNDYSADFSVFFQSDGHLGVLFLPGRNSQKPACYSIFGME